MHTRGDAAQHRMDERMEAVLAHRALHGPCLRSDGTWLAYANGLPLMTADYSNRVFRSREAAEIAIREAS